MHSKDIEFMTLAMNIAEQAFENGNQPFGAVLVKNDEVVFTNENQIYSKTDPTYHAEMGLLRDFCQETGITDLREYTMYSSCEPCYMCSGGMVWTQLGRLVYGASDKDLGDLIDEPGSECSQTVFDHSFHKPLVLGGVLRERGIEILAKFFSK